METLCVQILILVLKLTRDGISLRGLEPPEVGLGHNPFICSNIGDDKVIVSPIQIHITSIIVLTGDELEAAI